MKKSDGNITVLGSSWPRADIHEAIDRILDMLYAHEIEEATITLKGGAA